MAVEPDDRISGFTRGDFRVGIWTLARLARLAEQTFQTAGLSLPQYRLLGSLAGRPQRASELARRVGVSRPTMSALVNGLERDRLLRRTRLAADRRGIWLEATSEGVEAIERAEQALVRRLFAMIEPDLARQAVRLVVALREALERESEAPVPWKG